MFNKFVITLTIFVMVMGVNAAKGKVGEKLDNKCQETIVKSKELAEARHESKGVLNSITGQFHRLANGAGFASCIHSSPKMIKEAFKKQWKGDNCKGKAADKFVEKITKDGKIQKVAAVTNTAAKSVKKCFINYYFLFKSICLLSIESINSIISFVS